MNTENENVRPLSIFAKVAKISGELGAVKKSGRNEHQKYDYQSADDVMTALNPLLSKYNLSIIPIIKGWSTFEAKDGKQRYVIEYEFILACGETGEMFTCTWVSEALMSQGQNNTPDDKAMGKAHTYAQKYWLIQLFKITTKDQQDIDKDDSKQDEKPAAKVKNEQRQAVESGEPEILTTDATVKIVTKKSANGKLYRVVQGNCLWNRDAFRQLKYPENIIEAMNKEGEITLPDPIFIEYIEKPKENGQGKDTTPLRMIRKNKNWVVDIKNTKE